MPKLAHTTVVNYRSRLKLLRLVYDKLPEDEKDKAKDEIAILEAKLGPFAEPERRPGRPKTRTEVPDALRPQELRTAVLSDEEKEKIKREKLKAKLAKLHAETVEAEARLKVQENSESEFDKANKAIQEAINAEKAHGGAEEAKQGDGRTGGEGQRGVGEEAEGEGK